MGLIANIKKEVKERGNSVKEIIFFQTDKKRRIRFLQELDDGLSYKFHSSFTQGVNEICAEQFGDDCIYCDSKDDSIKDEIRYIWSVYDYDSNSVKIMMFKVSRATPVESFIELADNYGTIIDRDYTLKKNGTGTDSSYSVVPSDRSPFRNKKAKAFSQSQVEDILRKAYSSNDLDDDDEQPEKKKSKSKKNKKAEKTEPTLRENLEELDLDDLKDICEELGIAKKSIKSMDEDDIIELIFEDYEDDDIQDVYDDWMDENE